LVIMACLPNTQYVSSLIDATWKWCRVPKPFITTQLWASSPHKNAVWCDMSPMSRVVPWSHTQWSEHVLCFCPYHAGYLAMPFQTISQKSGELYV
jgi:hypothetical protein